MERGSVAEVIVIGSINTDLVASVENLPQRGESVHAKIMQSHLGGKGANQAVATKLFGSAVKIVGCIGDDERGEKALEGFDRVDVDRSLVRVIEGVSTGTALITVDKKGENTIVVVKGANGELTADDIKSIRGELFQATAVMLQLEVSDEVVLAVAALVDEIRRKKANPWFVFNPSPFRLSAIPPKGTVDLLLVNELEAEAMSAVTVDGPESAAKAASALTPLLRNGGCVVVTLGTQGAVALAQGGGPFSEGNEDLLLYIPALKVDAVDTTGAGDVFTGGLVAKLVAGNSLRKSVRFATAAAAITVMKEGAQTSYPASEEVEKLLPYVAEAKVL